MNSYDSDSESGEMEMPPIQSIEEFWGKLILFKHTIHLLLSCSSQFARGQDGKFFFVILHAQASN